MKQNVSGSRSDQGLIIISVHALIIKSHGNSW